MAKNETPKTVREVPYRFICEHCGTQTEWKSATVSADSEEAMRNTVIPKLVTEVQQGNYFEFSNMAGKCESCGHRQSWELGEAKAWMRRSPLMGLGIGGMIGGVGAFISVFLFGLVGAFVIFIAISLIGMIGAFIYGLVQYVIVRSNMDKTSLRYSPEIVWERLHNAENTPQKLPVEPGNDSRMQFPPPSSQPVNAADAQFAPPNPQPLNTTAGQFPPPSSQPIDAVDAQFPPPNSQPVSPARHTSNQRVDS